MRCTFYSFLHLIFMVFTLQVLTALLKLTVRLTEEAHIGESCFLLEVMWVEN